MVRSDANASRAKNREPERRNIFVNRYTSLSKNWLEIHFGPGVVETKAPRRNVTRRNGREGWRRRSLTKKGLSDSDSRPSDVAVKKWPRIRETRAFEGKSRGDVTRREETAEDIRDVGLRPGRRVWTAEVASSPRRCLRLEYLSRMKKRCGIGIFAANLPASSEGRRSIG